MSEKEYEIKVEVRYTCHGSVERVINGIKNGSGTDRGYGIGADIGSYSWQCKSQKISGPFYKRKTRKEPHNAPTP